MSFELESFFTEQRARVDAALDAWLPAVGDADPGRLKEGMRYGVLQGGKRMRPMVTLAASLAAGGDIEDGLPPSCAIELIHAYSLVHDDLPAMDNDIERRGKPTVHVEFGEANAILIGDALLTVAFEILAKRGAERPRSRTADAVLRLAHHAGIHGMVGGQALDIAHGQDISSLELLEQVHAWKTGGLYAASGAMGALCAGAEDGVVEALESWGLKFGIAFQHADDVLDDDQPALRQQALARVETLVKECHGIADRFGERGEPLQAIAEWVGARAQRAHAGDKSD